MEEAELESKLHKHLLATVGEKPSKAQMEEVDKQIRKMYDKVYDSPNKSSSFLGEAYTEIAHLWEKVVATETTLSELLFFQKYAKPLPDFKITSFASGLAVYELFLAKEFVPEGFVTCLDISEGMCEEAEKFAKKLNQKNIEIINASIIKTPLEEGSQDIVLARRTGLSKDKIWLDVLKEANRILKKNDASTFIYTVDKIYNDPLEEIKSNLQKADLAFIAMEETHISNSGTVCMIIAKPTKG